MDKTKKESLFNDHIYDIKDKRKKSFRKLLQEADVSCTLFFFAFFHMLCVRTSLC